VAYGHDGVVISNEVKLVIQGQNSWYTRQYVIHHTVNVRKVAL